jgi:hypothetical protein
MPTHDHAESCAMPSSPPKKTWVTPELQDQSIQSITESTKVLDITEFNSTNGPVS